jgi:hypothetical protein
VETNPGDGWDSPGRICDFSQDIPVGMKVEHSLKEKT